MWLYVSTHRRTLMHPVLNVPTLFDEAAKAVFFLNQEKEVYEMKDIDCNLVHDWIQKQDWAPHWL